MNLMGIIIATVVVGGLGILLGLFLGMADKKLAVETDEREEQIKELLPGNNCGGCGHAGCEALAKAILEGKASPNDCPVAASENRAKIAELLGLELEEKLSMVAFVRCMGTCDRAEDKYIYTGNESCKMLARMPGNGPKACVYGCCGFGSCVESCTYDAIHIIDGVAKVDSEKCKGCGKCVRTCSRNLIVMVPKDSGPKVHCNSKDSGKEVRKVCKAGCIGCKICVKQCEFDAITVADNVAYIDPEKCKDCGKCVEKCPQKCIE